MPNSKKMTLKLFLVCGCSRRGFFFWKNVHFHIFGHGNFLKSVFLVKNSIFGVIKCPKIVIFADIFGPLSWPFPWPLKKLNNCLRLPKRSWVQIGPQPLLAHLTVRWGSCLFVKVHVSSVAHAKMARQLLELSQSARPFHERMWCSRRLPSRGLLLREVKPRCVEVSIFKDARAQMPNCT